MQMVPIVYGMANFICVSLDWGSEGVGVGMGVGVGVGVTMNLR